MVFFQFFQAVNSRSETESIFRLSPFGNPMLAYGFFASVLAHLGSIYLAPLQWVFHTKPIGGHQWIKIIAISLTVILIVEIDKWLRRRAMMTAGERRIPLYILRILKYRR